MLLQLFQRFEMEFLAWNLVAMTWLTSILNSTSYPRFCSPEFANSIICSIPPRNLLDVLARVVTQQASQVGLAQSNLFHTSKGWCKHLAILRHLSHKLLNILLRQIALRRWASFGYNSYLHGFLRLLPTSRWSEKDTMPFYFRLSCLPFVDLAL
jgi:hypothetical protein